MESGTLVTISCVVTGITKQLDGVVWKRAGTDVMILSETDYAVSEGSYDSVSNSQTTTLTVQANANIADTIYTCAIDSNEHGVTNKDTFVILNVFGK